jgi:hypothetical protein
MITIWQGWLQTMRDDYERSQYEYKIKGWFGFEKWSYGIAYSITYKNNYMCTNISIRVFNLFSPWRLGMIRDDHNMAGVITND